MTWYKPTMEYYKAVQNAYINYYLMVWKEIHNIQNENRRLPNHSHLVLLKMH